MNKESEILFKSVESIIRKLLKNISYDKEGMILNKKENEKYSVIIDGNEYEVKNGTTWDFHQSDKCLVHYINGNENRKIIIAKL